MNSVNGKPFDLSRGAAVVKIDWNASSIVMAMVNGGKVLPVFIALKILGRGKTWYFSFVSSSK